MLADDDAARGAAHGEVGEEAKGALWVSGSGYSSVTGLWANNVGV